MLEAIGQNAGKIWHYLEDHPGATMEQIEKELSLKESPVCMGVGWLAREGKLAFEDKGRKTKLFLIGR
jgi:hypothetical protein